MEYNYGVPSSTIRSKDKRDKFVSLINEPLKEEGRTTPTGKCKAELSGVSAVSMEDDIINLIGVQDGTDSADLQNVFGMVSYLTG